MAGAISARDVREAVKGALGAAPKGARIAGYRARIVEGNIDVEVTLAADSVQPPPREAWQDEAAARIRERARAARGS